MYQFFIKETQCKENEVILQGQDVNHIANVLRLDIKEEIELVEEENEKIYRAEIKKIEKQQIICQIKEEKNLIKEKIQIHLFQGLPKAEKMETIIQKTTEIGICEITPLRLRRCIVKLDDKTEKKKLERWQKIAEAASKQCKANQITKIHYPIEIKTLMKQIENFDLVLVAYEKEKQNTIKKVLQMQEKKPIKLAIIIGPEGGIEETEIEELIQNIKVKTISLGRRILRTETAPMVLTSILQYEFGE